MFDINCNRVQTLDRMKLGRGEMVRGVRVPYESKYSRCAPKAFLYSVREIWVRHCLLSFKQVFVYTAQLSTVCYRSCSCQASDGLRLMTEERGREWRSQISKCRGREVWGATFLEIIMESMTVAFTIVRPYAVGPIIKCTNLDNRSFGGISLPEAGLC